MDRSYDKDFKRMQYLEAHLYWLGWVRRKDIVKYFQISTERAANTIKKYIKNYDDEDKIYYDYSEKLYKIKDGFTPKIIKSNINKFVEYVNRCVDSFNINDISTVFMQQIDVQIIRKLCFSITTIRPIEIIYASLNSGNQQRTILPHALFYDGIKIYARSFCYKDKKHKDFCLSRIVEHIRYDTQSHKVDDIEWETMETIKIIPHPKLSDQQKHIIIMDYNMKDGCSEITLRKPLMYYFIKKHNLDFEHSDPLRQQIVMENKT